MRWGGEDKIQGPNGKRKKKKGDCGPSRRYRVDFALKDESESQRERGEKVSVWKKTETAFDWAPSNPTKAHSVFCLSKHSIFIHV